MILFDHGKSFTPIHYRSDKNTDFYDCNFKIDSNVDDKRTIKNKVLRAGGTIVKEDHEKDDFYLITNTMEIKMNYLTDKSFHKIFISISFVQIALNIQELINYYLMIVMNHHFLFHFQLKI